MQVSLADLVSNLEYEQFTSIRKHLEQSIYKARRDKADTEGC